MAVSPRIFVSYRRDDASGHAGRLYADLRARFPNDVFRDVDTLEPGEDFIRRLEELVGSADVLIAVIGRGWSSTVDEHGNRRLDDPQDFVRLEVGGALRRDIRVIPVLVGGAQMPTVEELPEDLAGLARRNGLVISDLDWPSGVEKLFTTIGHVLGVAEPPPPPPPPPLSSAVLPLALVGAGLLTIGLFMRWDSGYSFIQNDFGGNAPHGGAFTSLAPIGIVTAAVLGGLVAPKPSTRAMGVGLLFAAGFAGIAKYVRVLLAGHDASTGATIGVVVAVAGGILVLAAGLLALRATTRVESAPKPVAAILGIGGAGVMVAASAVPFSGGGTNFGDQSVFRSLDESFEQVATSIAIAVIAALLLGRWRHAELSAALLTLGVLNALLWMRFLVIPLILDDRYGSFGPGGLVGLAGAALVVIGGVLGLQGSKQPGAVAASAQT
jgi:TIR domain